MTLTYRSPVAEYPASFTVVPYLRGIDTLLVSYFVLLFYVLVVPYLRGIDTFLIFLASSGYTVVPYLRGIDTLSTVILTEFIFVNCCTLPKRN